MYITPLFDWTHWNQTFYKGKENEQQKNTIGIVRINVRFRAGRMQ